MTYCVKIAHMMCAIVSMSQPVSDHQRLVDKLIERNPDESEKEHCSWLWELADGDQDNEI